MAKALRDLLGERIQHPYDRGYWLRYRNRPLPVDAEDDTRQGYDACDDEIAEEEV